MKARLCSGIVCLMLCFWSVGLASGGNILPRTTPEVTVYATRPADCEKGGLHLVKGYVKSYRKDEPVDILFYIQRYDGVWTKKYFNRKGTGEFVVNLSSCDFTGNYYVFACYSVEGVETMPDLRAVQQMHHDRGIHPRLTVTKKVEHPAECGGRGLRIIEGEVFTPKGEEVEITLLLEKSDGTWRKKHYLFKGSGTLVIEEIDCYLTGNYKTLVLFRPK